ncbi:MAG: hypothetical protein JWM85_1913 [Acidimicrobiaceae bacterium]|nr:hypothetical protein [Acidimicrobiaceae bacterium]
MVSRAIEQAAVELGIFARIFPRSDAGEVAEAIAEAGYTTTQLNLSSIGLPTVPPVDLPLDLAGVRAAFSEEGVRVWGLSATYNVIHPDTAKRKDETDRAKALIARAPALGVEVVTLCSGSRDPANMWRRHPDNDSEEAWRDLRATLDELLAPAERAGVRLGIEPEPGNVVSDAGRGRRLLDELGDDARLIGIVLDPANLVSPSTVGDQEKILRSAFAQLGPETVALHAKDVVADGGYAAAGVGELDYDLIFELHESLERRVPVIVQDADESDAARVREFLLEHSGGRSAR